MDKQPDTLRARCARCGAFLSEGGSARVCARCLLVTALRINPVEEESESESGSPTSLLARGELGHYKLLGELGRGGMGIVFKARQKEPDRLVALKVAASGELASPRMVARFRLEARMAATLHHPNIVPVFEVGEQAGWHFFSMQLIEGPTLAEVLQKGGTSPEAAARLLLTISQAVAHAHQRGILHRDIKPTNILLDSEGEPHLTDFGLAKALDHESDLTVSRAVVGTPAYMSPEQAAGRNRDITTATDVYGIGAILYEMLSGQPPFAADSTQALLRKVADEDPVAPSRVVEKRMRGSGSGRQERRSGIPHDLEIICLKCLEKAPGRRYATAGELAADLQRWMRHEPILARPVSLGNIAMKWAGRHPAAAGWLATGLLATLGIVIGSWVFSVRLNRARLVAEQRARDTLAQVVDQHVRKSAALSGHADALTGLHSLVEAVRISGEFPDMQPTLRLRLALASAFSARPLRVWDAGGSPTEFQFSTDETELRVLLRSARPRLFKLADPAQTHEPPPVTNNPPLTGFQLSADARVALEMFDAPPFARVLNTATGGTMTLPVKGPCGEAGAFSTDGRLIATGGSDVRVWNAANGIQIGPTMNYEAPCVWTGFSPDGRRLLTIHANQNALLWEIPQGRVLGDPAIARRFGSYFQPVFSRDGASILLADMQETYLYDGRDFSRKGMLIHPGVVFAAAFNPDGSAIATASFRASARVWNAKTLEPMLPQLNHENGARCVAFSPDGETLATGGFDYQVRLWRRNDRHQLGSALPHRALVTALTFSPSGRYLATASAEGLVRLWDIEGVQQTFLARGVPGVPLAYSPDRRSFAMAESAEVWRLHSLEANRVVSGVSIPVSSQAVVAWDSQNGKLATAAPNDMIRLWDSQTGLETARFPSRGTVKALRFSPDGTRLAVCGEPGWAGIVAIGTGTETPFQADPRDQFLAVAWDPKGQRVATGEVGQMRIWDATSFRQVGETVRGTGQVNAVQFSPDGKQVVAPFTDEAIEPRVALIVDAMTGRSNPRPLEHGDGVWDAIFSPDGRKIVTAGEDNTVRLWNAVSGLPAGPAMRHEAMVRCAAFAPGERYLATGGNDHTLRFWEVANGERLGPPLLFGSPVTSVGFTPNGETVVVGLSDGSVWTLDFRQDSRPLSAISRVAILATAHRMDVSGGLIPVRPDALEREYFLLAGESPASLQTLSSPVQWHRTRAALAEIGTNAFAARFHLERLAAASPDDPTVASRLDAARRQAPRSE